MRNKGPRTTHTIHILIVALLMACGCEKPPPQPPPRPVTPPAPPKPAAPVRKGPAVKVRGRALMVDFDGDNRYEPYLVKGVGYQAVPIGSGPFVPDNPRILERDFSFLQEIGCNTIRTWARVNTNLLDVAQKYGIKVIAGFKPYEDTLEFSNPANRRKVKRLWREYIYDFKDHPAILFWAIGNEDNLHYKGKNIRDWYTLGEEMARDSKAIEGNTAHPVAMVVAEMAQIGDRNACADDDSLKHVDIWGMNIYIGRSFEDSKFGNFFGYYARASKKPLWCSEYGIDAWDHVNKREHQDAQADWVSNNFAEMARSSVCIGGTLMAYSDEWWKSGTPEVQEFGGYEIHTHPDHYSNEEWWGIVAMEKVPGSIDRIRPRKVCYALQKLWKKKYDLRAKYASPVPKAINPEALKRKGVACAMASSNQANTMGPEAAVDGNIGTRWESRHALDPSWITLELQRTAAIGGIKINWETASALEYQIQLSRDGKNWNTVAHVTDGKEGEERVLRFSPVAANYVRIYCIRRTTQWGYSIWEIELNPR